MDEKVNVIYEDNHLLVVVKPQNVPVQQDASGDKDLLTMLKEYVKEKYNKPGDAYVGLVHRLDRPTGGVMVFARTSKAAARLQECMKEGEFEKRYFAVVCGEVKQKRKKLVDYLLKNSATNTVMCVPQATDGAKRAELDYRVLAENKNPDLTLVDVALITGRGHQARVQLANNGNPIFGDARYGGDKLAKGHNLSLWATELKFLHPVTKEKMVFRVFPPEIIPWNMFDMELFLNININN